MERNILWKPVGEVCAFSGYRPAKLPFSSESDPACTLLKLRLKEEIYDAIQQGSTDFVCGMALGTDTWAAETVLEIQQTLKDIKPIRLHAYLPFEGQDEKWSAKSRRRYREILSRCDSVTVISPHYLPDCMERRNRAMIHRANRLIAVFDGKNGGTKNTVRMAHEKGIEIRILSPIPPHYEAPSRNNEPSEQDGQIKLFF
ncbi:MAG: DUF1273 family protein [Clostridia bacterium]|nr:DUF1273 family protein [Clostridia bacterium]